MTTQLTVLGGGPGGYVAAVRAAQLGADVTLIENDALGGTCLNWGCIPSKILKATADRLYDTRRFGSFGIDLVGPPVLNLGALNDRKERVIGAQKKGIAYLLAQHGVTHISGNGHVTGAGRVVDLDLEPDAAAPSGTVTGTVSGAILGGTQTLANARLSAAPATPFAPTVLQSSIDAIATASVTFAVQGNSPITANIETDLPEPDSPTIDRMSFSTMLRSTPSTARKVPLTVSNSTERFRISSRLMIFSSSGRGRRASRRPSG